MTAFVSVVRCYRALPKIVDAADHSRSDTVLARGECPMSTITELTPLWSRPDDL